MNPITVRLREHYFKTFNEHGPTPKGVDWSAAEDVNLRYEKMLDVIEPRLLRGNEPVSLLDVGCGYGGLYLYARANDIKLNYTGIDVAENMIAYASGAFPEAKFQHQDVFDIRSDGHFDYAVCSGILTQKLTASIQEMDEYANQLIKKMFGSCRRGIAFNVMTTKVNFMVENLYYRNPVELLALCLQVSPKIRVDHAYPLYEYTVYLYQPDTPLNDLKTL